MFLEGGTREHFMQWLAQNHADLVLGYERLYAGKYAAGAYRKAVSTTVQLLRGKYGLDRRESGDTEEASTPPVVREARQRLLNW
jgi:hypothetical protein